MKISDALTILALPKSLTEVYENKLSIRKAYLQAALRSHPDRVEGDNHSMAKINAAYDLLRSHVKTYEYQASSNKKYEDKFYCNNEGHPLFNAAVPALKPVSILLREAFDIRDSLDSMPGLFPVSNQSNNLYFQYEGNDYELFWFGGSSIDSFSIRCITNAGRHGCTCSMLKFYVESWYGYSEREEQVFNLIKCLLSESSYAKGNILAEDVEQFSWGKVFHDFMFAFGNAVEISDCEKRAVVFGHEFTKRTGRFSRGCWDVKILGVTLSLYVVEDKAISVFNPFKLDCYKPLKVMPVKLKTIDLIKMLANGQYKRLKRHYRHTDDYAHDADIDCGRGFIDNPFSLLKDWVEDRGSAKERRVYVDENATEQVKINFGSYSYELYSLIFDVDNGYPLIDLTQVAIEQSEYNLLCA